MLAANVLLFHLRKFAFAVSRLHDQKRGENTMNYVVCKKQKFFLDCVLL